MADTEGTKEVKDEVAPVSSKRIPYHDFMKVVRAAKAALLDNPKIEEFHLAGILVKEFSDLKAEFGHCRGAVQNAKSLIQEDKDRAERRKRQWPIIIEAIKSDWNRDYEENPLIIEETEIPLWVISQARKQISEEQAQAKRDEVEVRALEKIREAKARAAKSGGAGVGYRTGKTERERNKPPQKARQGQNK